MTDTYTYDAENRLTDLVTTDASATILAAYHYQYAGDHSTNRTDEWDNLLAAGDPNADTTGRHVQYTYDNEDRLSSETITSDPGGINGTINYAYDLVGNRLTRTSSVSGVADQTLSYNADDRLTSDTYDANGNTTDDGTHAYVYDALNRLIREILDATQAIVASFAYDGAGNRVSATTDSGTTLFLVDSNNPTGYSQVVEELESSGGTLTVTREYVYGLSILTESQDLSGTWTTSTYGPDGHGNTRLLTNAAGQVTDTVTYEAYGTILEQTGTTPNDVLYSGQMYDASLGMYYNRARYLNVNTGRFWTADTYEGNINAPLTLNGYLFGDANPVNRVDPSGHFSLSELMVGTSIIAGLNGLLGAALGGRHGWRGAVGGLVGGIDSTYISVYGTVYTLSPTIGFAAGAAVGAASELLITYGPSYFNTWQPWFTIGIAAAVGGIIGCAAGASTMKIAEKLGTAILQKPGFSALVSRLFDDPSIISTAPKQMVDTAMRYPFLVMQALDNAIHTAFSEALKDTVNGLLLGGGITTVTDAVADEFVHHAQEFVDGLHRIHDNRQGLIDGAQ